MVERRWTWICTSSAAICSECGGVTEEIYIREIGKRQLCLDCATHIVLEAKDDQIADLKAQVAKRGAKLINERSRRIKAEAQVAEYKHQAERNKGYLESIWKVIYPKSDWEYLGQISTHTIQVLHEHKEAVAHKDRVIEVLAERCNELIEDPNPAQGAPVKEWIQWAEAKANSEIPNNKEQA